MEMRSRPTLSGLEIGLTMAALPRPIDAVNPRTIGQLEALIGKYTEALNNNDAAAVAALFTKNAVFATDTGTVYGPEGVEKWYEAMFKLRHCNFTTDIDPYSPHLIGKTENEVWVSGEWSGTVQPPTGPSIPAKGFWSAIYAREGDAWLYKMLTFNKV
jgi:uncharacterized protein (TIGR02246 family)